MSTEQSLSRDYDELGPQNIWNWRQNKPSYVASDLNTLAGVPRELTYKVLLARGVFKWLSVRRGLIKLKDLWKERERETLKRIKERERMEYHRGYLRGVQECRKEVRGLCHSERWVAPDYDREAVRFLERGGR